MYPKSSRIGASTNSFVPWQAELTSWSSIFYLLFVLSFFSALNSSTSCLALFLSSVTFLSHARYGKLAIIRSFSIKGCSPISRALGEVEVSHSTSFFQSSIENQFYWNFWIHFEGNLRVKLNFLLMNIQLNLLTFSYFCWY